MTDHITYIPIPGSDKINMELELDLWNPSKCLKHNMDASMSAIGYGLRYFKQKEKEFEKMNRKEMSEEIINGLTTGAYVLTSCCHSSEIFGSEIIAHFAVNPGFFDTPKLKSKALAIRKVIFNDPATIVFWADGDKTVVKCGENDIFDPEKGLALAISKKFFGNKGKYYDIFKKWLPEEYKESAPLVFDIVKGSPLSKAIDEAIESIKNLGNAYSNPKDNGTD